MVLGCLVLAGWAADLDALKRLSPTLVAMNPATAVLFVLAGTALLVRDRHRGATRALAVAIVAAATAKLMAYALDASGGVDRWLFASRLDAGAGLPNRMAPNTALCFLLVGAALLCVQATTRRGWRPSELLAGLGFMTALLALTGYAYRVDDFVGLAGYIPMALHTAIGLVVLSSGIFMARTDAGMMRVLASPGAGGTLARRLLPALVVVLLLTGWLRLEGERRGLYSTGLGVALYTMTSIVLLGALVWWAARSLDRADRARVALAEQQRDSEARMRSIIESASDAFIAIDADGRVIGWNAQTETMFGWPRAEALGGLLSDMILPPQHRQAHEDGLRRFAATGEGPVLNKRIEISALRRSGEEFPIELAIWPVWARGQCTFNAFIRDISERRRTEEIQARFAAIVTSSDDAILSKTLDGTITSWNPGAERMFGYRADEAIGRPAAMLLPAERASEEAGILARIGQGERVEHFETVRVTADGARIDVEATMSPLRDAAGAVVGASTIARDITRRKQADARIRSLNAELADNAAQLEHSNRELEAFSYTVSHDLRAPLRHIDGYALMLKEDAGDRLDTEMRRYLDSIGDAARQMGALIDDLLAFSRLGRKPVERVEVDMHALVAHAAA
ncbi:MAG: PAS domain S-box protein, partial [Pseudomonas sp.]|nr:PAS domain S-box protein [Pseudomonas sp.]